MIIKVLFYITKGDIPISSSTLKKLTSSKVAKLLHRKFLKKRNIQSLLKETRANKISVLSKISQFLPDLFESLFSPPKEWDISKET